MGFSGMEGEIGFSSNCPHFLCTIVMASTTKRADFEAVWPGLVKDILAHAQRYNLPANALEWFEKVGSLPNWNL